jgi:hypothetical protein
MTFLIVLFCMHIDFCFALLHVYQFLIFLHISRFLHFSMRVVWGGALGLRVEGLGFRV